MTSRMTTRLVNTDATSEDLAVTRPLDESLPKRDAGRQINHRQRYATFEELDWLRDYASTLPAHTQVIMLGAGPGVMLAALKDGNPAIDIFVVDNQTCDYAIAHLHEFGPDYVANVNYFIGDSATVGTRYEGRLATLLVIDADHSERGAFNDLVCWLSHVEPGGIIMMHDYDASGTWFEGQEQYPGVKIACDKLLRTYKPNDPFRVGTSALYVNEQING